ncbi:MAG: peroxiredoxin [Polyangiaceae bacterium]
MKRWFLMSCVAALGCGVVGCKSDPSGPSPSSSASAVPSGLLAEGAAAPAIETTAHDGSHVSFAALKGKPIVVYFYPKDDTPGCTKEACELRDAYTKIQETGAVVFGVSTDDNASHTAFATKHNLPFQLLPDKDAAIAKAFGVSLRLGMAKRVTFVIDRAGRIAKVFPDVNPTGHAAEILTVLANLKS